MATGNDTDLAEMGVGELTDIAVKKAAQLRSLLCMTYGEAADVFQRMSKAAQEDYLWACSDLADGVCQALAQVESKEVQHG
jgi:hypothetical protein